MPPFDARKRLRKAKAGGASGRAWDPAKHPRGGQGRFITVGARIEAAAQQAGKNAALHVDFAAVRRPAELSKLVGVDVRSFRHAVSNQAMAHTLRKHGSAATEAARGQKAISAADFRRLPDIARSGTYRNGQQRSFGPPRAELHATVGGDSYVYVFEVRAGKRRLDMVTMWKR